MKILEEARSVTTSNLAPASDSREQLANRYREVRSFTERLCEPLEIEDYVVQSMPDASPAKWHLAHTTWFFETFILKIAEPHRSSTNAKYAYLFNSYYNAVGPMHCRPRRGMISRPTVEETLQYRRQIDEQVLGFFESANEQLWRELESVVILGLHHEQQHQELLLTDLKHLFAQNPLYPVYRADPTQTPVNVGPLQWAAFPEGLYSIGHKEAGFAFDNEGPCHREFLTSFQIASRPVTNGEYLAFVEDGGYTRPELWLSLGWATVNENKWQAPLYWENQDGGWLVFTLSGLRPVEESEPACHLSYFEADAYARWAGARLPTEAEWEVAAADLPLTGNFVEQKHFHPQPNAAGEGRGALTQMFGDVWEWTRSSYSPYPGYEVPRGALGEYNGKFMCNQYVLRGGSCATPQSHIRKTYRNFFAPDKRWQFMGVRLARDIL